MNQRIVVILIIMGFFLPIVVNAATPQQEDLQPNATIDVWVNALGSYNYYWSNIGEDYRINVEIDVTSGSDIDFYIVDEDNYDIWRDGGTANADILRQNAGSISLTFTVPSSGEWHLLFINDNWLFRKHLEGTITATAPSVPNAAGALAAVVVLGIIVICIAGCAAKAQKDKQDKQVPSTPSHYQVQQPTVNASQQVSYCPFCGTPKHLPDAKFCSKCGRSFSGPEFQ